MSGCQAWQLIPNKTLKMFKTLLQKKKITCFDILPAALCMNKSCALFSFSVLQNKFFTKCLLVI